MKFRFQMKKYAATSASQVVANYLDIEHLRFHARTTLKRLTLVSATERAACFFLTNKLGFLTLTTFNYYEYRPPNQFFQVAFSSILCVAHCSTIIEKEPGKVEILVDVEVQMPWILAPFRPLMEFLLRWQDRRIHEEDREILERRYKLRGAWIEDYLRPWQPLLFKEAFARAFSKGAGTHPGSLQRGNL